MAVACSHGTKICPAAREGSIKFRQRLKPKVVVHLGDFLDTEAWMRSRQTMESKISENPKADVEAGFKFLKDLGVTHACMGNHDERPYRYLHSKDDIIRLAASYAVDQLENEMRRLKISFVNEWSVWKWHQFGDWQFMHGNIHNKRAAAMTAMAQASNVCFGHTHLPMLDRAESRGDWTGICAGTLSRIDAHEYAKNRHRTLGWGQAVAWGWFTDDKRRPECRMALWNVGRNQAQEPWILPF